MKICIIICVFERPDELYFCLESIKRTTDTREMSIVMIDDASKNPQTKALFDSFFISGVPICKIRNDVNSRVAVNLKKGFGKAFSMGAELGVVLDSDAIVKPDWLEKIKDLKRRFPEKVISGFNSLTKGENGKERHPVYVESGDYCIKKSVGGINVAADFELYRKYVNVGLDNSIRTRSHWDTVMCQVINSEGGSIAVTTPSVVEHISRVSTLGHNTNPDRSSDWEWDREGIFTKQNVFAKNNQQITNTIHNRTQRNVFRRQ